MGKVTFVFEYEDGKEPTVNAGMEFMGGRVVEVSFSDYRDNFFTTEQREVLSGMVEKLEDTDVMDKLELLTM